VRQAALTLRREDGRIVCEHVRVVDTLFRRMRGLLGRNSLPIGQGMVLRPAVSIHTAFMRFPIDVVFLDPQQVVIRIDPYVTPFNAATCFEAREVVALPAGECERRELRVGDRVAWAALSDADTMSAEQALPVPPEQAHVLVASSDQRFVKLSRYLLGERRIGVAGTVAPSGLSSALRGDLPDAVLIDAGSEVGEGLRAANAVRARTPEVPVVVAAENGAERSPDVARVYDKWNETEELVEAIARAVGAPAAAGRAETGGG
jgi:uncharacterized protein